MSGVNIPSCAIEAEGISWVASWDDKGTISYKGIGKDGKEVTTPPPSDVVKAARAYGAGFGGGENSEKPSEEQGGKDSKDKSEDILVIETNKDGTLKSVSIAEVNWTDKQREFVEKCLRAAAEQGRNAEHGEAAAAKGADDNQSGKIDEFLRKNPKSLSVGEASEHKPNQDEIGRIEALDNCETAYLDQVRGRMNDIRGNNGESDGFSNKNAPGGKRSFAELSGRTGPTAVRLSSNPLGRPNVNTSGHGK